MIDRVTNLRDRASVLSKQQLRELFDGVLDICEEMIEHIEALKKKPKKAKSKSAAKREAAQKKKKE